MDSADVARFARSLGAASPAMRIALKAANGNVAQYILAHAKARASTRGRQAAKAAASLRASNGASSSQVRGGSGAVPFFMGAELGASRWKQFDTWRGTAPSDALAGGVGYFLFPSIREGQHDILNDYRDSVLKPLAPAFK